MVNLLLLLVLRDDPFFFELCLLFGEGVGIHVISHSFIVVNGPNKFGFLDMLIDIRRVWVLNETIAGWVFNFECEWEDLTHSVRDTLLQERVDLGSCRRVVLPALFLHLAKAFDSRQQETFDCLDGTLLSLSGDLQLQFWDTNRRELGLDDRSVHAVLIDDLQFVLDSSVSKFTTELDLSVLVSALFT